MKKILALTIIMSTFLFSTMAFAHGTESHVKKKADKRPDAKYAWKVNWLSLDEGIKKSMAEGKPMLIDFATHEGCDRCEYLQKHVYSKDKIVNKINKSFIPIFIDLSKDLSPDEQALGEKHEYHEDCLLLFLDHKKEPIFDAEENKMCFADTVEPDIYMRYLDYIIDLYSKKSL